MLFSILIPTLKSRAELLRRLIGGLQLQINGSPLVEILTDPDDGERSIGEKRNALLDAASGEYVAFHDDDDPVAGDYIPRIMDALKSGTDVVGICGVIQFEHKPIPRQFRHSIEFDTWFTRSDGVYCRCPNHLNPVKRSLAMQTRFPHSSFGEDKAYSLALRPLLKTEVMLEGPIYWYLAKRRRNGPTKQLEC